MIVVKNSIRLSIAKVSFFLLFIAFSALLPLVFHVLQLNGRIFLPIYTMVLIGCFFLSPLYSIILAVCTPIINHLITGMPAITPFPAMQVLILELLFIAIAIQVFKRLKLHSTITIILALIIARISSLLLIPFIDAVTIQWWISNSIAGLPGLVFNFVISFFAVKVFNGKKISDNNA